MENRREQKINASKDFSAAASGIRRLVIRLRRCERAMTHSSVLQVCLSAFSDTTVNLDAAFLWKEEM